MPAPHISQWLSQALGSYRTRDAVQRDVELALDTYPSLKIKTDQYTYDDGRTLLLLCIHGTLPITYAGARYNVPIHCWLPLESPREPPLVYVVPTSTMLVRKGNGVALDGRVEDTESSYLGRWRRKPEAHSLLSLLQTLVDAFSAAPPVYAKPRTATPQSSSPASPTASSSSTSNPPRLGLQQAARAESLPTYSRPPPLPPLPPQTPPMGGHPTSQGSISPLGGPPAPPLPLGGASDSPVARPPWPPGAAPGAGFGYQSPPPPPLPPTSPTGSVTSQNQQPPYPGYRIPYPGQPPPPPMPSTDSPSDPGWATPSPPLPGWQGHRQQRASIGGGGPAPPQVPGTLHAFSQQQQPYRPPPPPLMTPQLQQPFPSSFPSTGPPPPSVQAPPPPIPTPSTRPPVASTPSVPIPDLLSAASPPPSPSADKSALPSAGPPPPPPPNPELLLLHSHLHSHLSAARDATLNSLQTRRHRLSQIRDDLASAEPAIEDEKARLGAVRDVCLGVGDRMRGSVKELEARVAMLEQRGEISVDEVVCSTTIVYNQLIDLVAEDAALSDALYQLSRALHADRIDITRFLKQARVLTREQFLKRALVERILSGGGKVPTGSG